MKISDRVRTNLKACIFPYDGGPSIMASKGTIGIVKGLPNDCSRNYKVAFELDGKPYWSTFSIGELSLV